MTRKLTLLVLIMTVLVALPTAFAFAQTETLNPADDPNYAIIGLDPNFFDLMDGRPAVVAIVSGGSVDASRTDSACSGFATSQPGLSVIRVRSFDVATFVAFGAAHLGIVGNDVLAEFGYSELYSPVDLRIGRCRLSVCEPEGTPPIGSESHVRVATKYPHLTQAHFARQGIQAECVKLNGAMELAPLLGLTPRIVDLVSTGRTLKENGLVERETILEVTSRLVVNRAAFKTHPEVARLVEAFRTAGQRRAA